MPVDIDRINYIFKRERKEYKMVKSKTVMTGLDLTGLVPRISLRKFKKRRISKKNKKYNLKGFIDSFRLISPKNSI